MTARNRCQAKTTPPHSRRCPHPGVELREGGWLCGNHLRVYAARGCTPKHWGWSTFSFETTAVSATKLEDEPESNAFLDDTPPPVWVDPSEGFTYPDEPFPQPTVDLVGDELHGYGDHDYDEPRTVVFWILLAVLATIVAFALGAWWGRTTADAETEPTKPAAQVFEAAHRSAVPAADIYGTDAATQFYATNDAPTPVQVQTYEVAAFTAAAQEVGSGVTTNNPPMLDAPDSADPSTGLSDSYWDQIAACEGNSWDFQGAVYSGHLGISNAAWLEAGGGQYGANAGQATREQQIEIANVIYSRHGPGAWGCKAGGAPVGGGGGADPPSSFPRSDPVPQPEVVYYWWVSW